MVANFKKESFRFRHNDADIHDHKVTMHMMMMVVVTMMIFGT